MRNIHGGKFMRIVSTDALRSNIKTETANMAVKMSTLENEKTIRPQNEVQIDKKPIDKELLEEAVEKFNKAVAAYNRECKISIHEKTGNIMVKIIDTETKEIVREIPPERILDIVAKMWEIAGILIDERR